MIIINSPHNPTGATIKETDMERLSQIVKGTDLLVLSDEVYEHLIFDGQIHQSACKNRTGATVLYHGFFWKDIPCHRMENRLLPGTC